MLSKQSKMVVDRGWWWVRKRGDKDNVEVGHPNVVTLGGIVPGQPVTGDVILRVHPRDALSGFMSGGWERCGNGSGWQS